MKSVSGLALAAALFALPVQAQVEDPNMTCEGYMKVVADMGATPKTGDAALDKMTADIDAKIAAYCKANPKAKAMEAVAKIMTQ
jgi:hypothetical protein